MKILAMDGDYSVYRLGASDEVPAAALEGPGFLSVTRSDRELSVLCATGTLPGAPREERDWTLWMVQGPLDFGMLGVLSSITAPLAAAGVSVFAVSTFDTDYILWKKDRSKAAIRALRDAGFEVEGSARFP